MYINGVVREDVCSEGKVQIKTHLTDYKGLREGSLFLWYLRSAALSEPDWL